MKRFEETTKYSDAWHRRLTLKHKCLWDYICLNCDAAGVFDPDWELVSFQIGEPFEESDLKPFGERILKLENGKFWIVKFVTFQYGKLSKNCRPHDKVFEAIKKNGLTYNESLDTVSARVSDTLQEEEEREEEDRKRKNTPEGKPSPAPDVEFSRGFPKTVEEAVKLAALLPYPKEFVEHTWHKANSRGGRDSRECDVRSWPSHLATEWKYEQQRTAAEKANGKVPAPAPSGVHEYFTIPGLPHKKFSLECPPTIEDCVAPDMREKWPMYKSSYEMWVKKRKEQR